MTGTSEALLPKEEEKKAEPLKQASIGELFMYTQTNDKILMAVGMLSAIITGMSMPSFVFLFRGLTNGFHGGIDP